MPHAKFLIQTGARHARSSRSAEDNLYPVNFFPDNLQCVDESSSADDRCPVLVIVKNGDVHHFFQLFFDVKAFGSFDIFKVDPPERRLQHLHSFYNVIGVVGIQFNIEDINICESFEEHSFPFHHRLSGERPDIAKSENCGSIRNNTDKVSFCCVFVSVVRVGCDLAARFGNAGGVRKR